MADCETLVMDPTATTPEIRGDEDQDMAEAVLDQDVSESSSTVTELVLDISEPEGRKVEVEGLTEPEVQEEMKTDSDPPKPDLDKTPETQLVESEASAAIATIDETELKDEPKEEVEKKCKVEDAELGTTNTKAVTVAEEDIEDDDDIILLDDDDESSVSDSKRPRKEDDAEIMEVDEHGVMTKDDKDNVGKLIRKMARSDLEDLVLAKIVEAIVAHTEVGQLRAKVLEIQQQKDKMATKMGVMMKQVAELSSAVTMIMENETRDAKNRIGKPHVIRFNRSVGLQTSIEPSVRSAPPKIIRVPDASQNGIKQYGASVGKQPVYSGTNGTYNPPQPNQAVKRVYQATKPGDNKAISSQTAAIQPSPRKTYSPASGGPTRILPIAPKPLSQQGVTVTPISQNVQPGIVDLTDDDPPPVAAQSTTNATGSTTIINGVQYQIVNRAPTTTGVQLMSSGAQSQQKYIVTPSPGQNRPVLLQHVAVGSTGGANQQFMLRGMNSSSPVTIIQRPVAPRPSPNGSLPRVAATIPVRPPGNVVLGTASNTPRRFILPPLPTTPVPKNKNDMFRPPPKPELTLNEQADGIVLSWNLPTVNNMAEVTTYQIFACQESLTTATNRPSQWKRVGDVKALPLPMACTLSQFTEENRYYFIVRGIDVYGRVGPFCDPQNILLRRKK